MPRLPPTVGSYSAEDHAVTGRLVGWVNDRRIETAVRKEVRIGTALSNDVVVDASDVEPHHARIWNDEDDCWVEDLSSGTTFVNGEFVPRKRLRHFDVITCGGSTDLVFLSSEPQAPADPPVGEPIVATQIDVEWKTALYTLDEALSPPNVVPQTMGARADTEGTSRAPATLTIPPQLQAPGERTRLEPRDLAVPTGIAGATNIEPLPAGTVIDFREVKAPPTGLAGVGTTHKTVPTPCEPPVVDESSEPAGLPIESAQASPTTSAVTRLRLAGDTGVFDVPLGRATVGRSRDATVHIDSREVSRVHAYVTVSRHEVSVEDNGSSNGTFVNGRRLTERRRIVTGDRVAFGNFEFRVELGQPEGDA